MQTTENQLCSAIPRFETEIDPPGFLEAVKQSTRIQERVTPPGELSSLLRELVNLGVGVARDMLLMIFGFLGGATVIGLLLVEQIRLMEAERSRLACSS